MSGNKNPNMKSEKGKISGKTKKVMSPSEARLQKSAKDEQIIKIIKIIFVSVIILAVAGTITGVVLAAYKPPVAWFGRERVTIPEFNYFLSEAKAQLQQQNIADYSDEESYWLSNIGGMTLIEHAKENALINARDTKVGAAKAKERGISLTDEEKNSVNSVIDSMISSAGGDRVLAGVNIKAAYGATLNEIHKIYEQMYLSQSLMRVMADEIVVTDEEAEARYNADIVNYDTVTVRHILISMYGTEEDPRTEEQSAVLAYETLARVDAGEDFAELVLELSEDENSLGTGGEYTFSRNDGFSEPFVEWAFAASVGETGVVEAEYGYHVMRLESKQIQTFEDAKDNVILVIKNEILSNQIDEWASDPKYETRLNDRVYQEISWNTL
ncbi:MAG: peptidylprolyl isomerase [Oscillospiraceae bacterium]|nr:peptidylprolyl isomerase [Oscillospiraceae bacterium]